MSRTEPREPNGTERNRVPLNGKGTGNPPYGVPVPGFPSVRRLRERREPEVESANQTEMAARTSCPGSKRVSADALTSEWP
jgi:hypothetical protein